MKTCQTSRAHESCYTPTPPLVRVSTSGSIHLHTPLALIVRARAKDASTCACSQQARTVTYTFAHTRTHSHFSRKRMQTEATNVFATWSRSYVHIRTHVHALAPFYTEDAEGDIEGADGSASAGSAVASQPPKTPTREACENLIPFLYDRACVNRCDNSSVPRTSIAFSSCGL